MLSPKSVVQNCKCLPIEVSFNYLGFKKIKHNEKNIKKELKPSAVLRYVSLDKLLSPFFSVLPLLLLLSLIMQ